MRNFWRSIRVAVLVSFTAMLFVPQLVQAQAGAVMPSNVGINGVQATEEPAPGATQVQPETKKGIIDKGLEIVGNAIKGTTLLNFFANRLDEAARVSPFENAFISCDPGTGNQCFGRVIQNGNAFILNLVNIFYVLVLLLIAIATIFDVSAYSIPRLLPRLVIAILLSNFGMYFVVVIANASQLLSVGLLSSVADKTLATPLIEATGTLKLIGQNIASTISTAGIITRFLIEVVNPLNWFTVAFALTTLILMLRMVGLWILAIFAPFGVAFGVLPVTQGFAKTYWRKVIQYAFVGPFLIFFVRLAVILYSSVKTEDTGFWATLAHADSYFSPLNTGNFFRALAAAVVLYVGIVLTRKMGVEVANFSIGLFEKAFKTSVGAMKVIAITAGAAATAGGSLAKLLAGFNFSPEQQKRTGELLTWAGTGLRGSGVGFMQKIGGVIKGPSEQLVKEQVAPEFKPPKGGPQGFRDRYIAWKKQNPDYVSMAKDAPDLLGTEIRNTADQSKKALMMMALAEAGKYVSGNQAVYYKRDDDGNYVRDNNGKLIPENIGFGSLQNQIADRSVLDYIKATATKRDWTIGATAPKGTAAYNTQIAAIAKVNDAHFLNAPALKDQGVIAAVSAKHGKTPKDWQEFVARLDISQKRSAGQGLLQLSKTELDPAKFLTLRRRSINLGVNPDVATTIVGGAGGVGPLPPDLLAQLSRAAKSLERISIGDPEAYVNQKNDIAVKMIMKQPNPDKVAGILNSPKVVPSMKQAIKEAAKRDIDREDREYKAHMALPGATPATFVFKSNFASTDSRRAAVASMKAQKATATTP